MQGSTIERGYGNWEDFLDALYRKVAEYTRPRTEVAKKDLYAGLYIATKTLRTRKEPGALVFNALINCQNELPESLRKEMAARKFSGQPGLLIVNFLDMSEVKDLPGYEITPYLKDSFEKADWKKERVIILRFVDGSSPSNDIDHTTKIPLELLPPSYIPSLAELHSR